MGKIIDRVRRREDVSNRCKANGVARTIRPWQRKPRTIADELDAIDDAVKRLLLKK